MTTPSLRQILNELLVDMYNHLLALEEQYHHAHGVDLLMSEIHTLEAVYKSDTKTMGDVASRLKITQGTLSVNINRLATKGYVTRVKDSADRRITRLLLSEQAKTVMKVHDQFHEEMIESIIDQLEEGVTDSLVKSLTQVNDFFKGLYDVDKLR